jgi:uncharacterized RDD family membrane protein YckC
MFCSHCGSNLVPGANFCGTCGQAVAAPSSPGVLAGGAAAMPGAYATTRITKNRPELIQPLPEAIVLSSAWRRLGGYLLDTLLVFATLLIGWLIWSIVVWGRGQTPAKQILGMRVIRDDSLEAAGRWVMVGRGLSKWLIGFFAGLIIVGYVVFFWLLWDKERQELWDKMCGTVVVNDRQGLLDPRHG